MAANKGLGKGLGALLGESAMQPSTQQSPLLLPLQKIEPNRLQPRKSFNEEELAALAGGHAGDDVGAEVHAVFGVECAGAAGDALHDQTSVLVNERCHCRNK